VFKQNRGICAFVLLHFTKLFFFPKGVITGPRAHRSVFQNGKLGHPVAKKARLRQSRQRVSVGKGKTRLPASAFWTLAPKQYRKPKPDIFLGVSTISISS